jgi:hypothetical protein
MLAEGLVQLQLHKAYAIREELWAPDKSARYGREWGGSPRSEISWGEKPSNYSSKRTRTECAIFCSDISLNGYPYKAYEPSEILILQPVAEVTVVFCVLSWPFQLHILPQWVKQLLWAITNKSSINIFHHKKEIKISNWFSWHEEVK